MASGKPNGKPNGEDDDIRAKEAAVAKTAGFVVFSGIAMSLIKALAPKKQSSPPTLPSPPPPSPSVDLSTKEPKTQQGRGSQTIEIVKGDTLWGLSKRYGVSIDAIKEANGLSSDTIYAGKKLIIP
ncbi:uncharacterized protein LOC116245274 [Nymphaea colorata]|nr:uncharacterized protein LOC116245274 [Nymphaea colorata]